ncbi:hypothetical protein PUNSTDRAFT_136519 [Punctularia strigosozonata HHB-11173 SS5]|uniref:uncharacterized protein n=1 Tax=Punctularia strigosozonata (strain HHB-11173) TaxID=741275 RepID=UPI0004417B60|nr:uncharacterized protein PUNSTDRAFT_136519 [Punctularia strigosozonata HHB-11173 SS5]EIN06674.1 hypothetical protein PUNSTDRAFT_136519 [Punctularia strigosozonata HHB-11173 SS5]
MSAAEVERLNQIVHVAQTYVASTTSVLVWDWLACLPQEYKYIWKVSWSPIKVLYLMVRYYTFVVLVVTDVWFFADWQEQTCAKSLRILPGLAVAIDLCVEMVLALRVYALYARDWRIGCLLVAVLAGFLGVMIAVPILAFDYTRLPSWPGPCLVTGKASVAGPRFIIAFYASPMTLDLLFTGLTTWRALKHRRSGTASGLIKVFLRDGILYFLSISALNLVNVIFFIKADASIQSINAPMSIQLSSVLCCRLILNLRAEHKRQPAVKRFATTVGRWIDDFRVTDDSQSDGHTVSLQSRTPRPAASAMRREPAGDGEPANGIVVHWEREVYDDTAAWDSKQVISRSNSDIEAGKDDLDLPTTNKA